MTILMISQLALVLHLHCLRSKAEVKKHGYFGAKTVVWWKSPTVVILWDSHKSHYPQITIPGCSVHHVIKNNILMLIKLTPITVELWFSVLSNLKLPLVTTTSICVPQCIPSQQEFLCYHLQSFEMIIHIKWVEQLKIYLWLMTSPLSPT